MSSPHFIGAGLAAPLGEVPPDGAGGGADAAAAAAGSLPPEAPAQTLTRISVVVPTYLRPDLLMQCLGALLQQSLPPWAYEIIVVDDGHSDATRGQVQALVAKLARLDAAPVLRYLRPSQGRGPAVARNCGWRAARAPLIAFTDDDTRPEPDWLLAGEQAMQRSLCVAMGGRVRVPLAPHEEAAPTDHQRMTRGLESAAFVTANAFVRRDALQQIGGFDERFRRAWREDSDLQFRLQQQAGPVGRCEQAVVLHPVRPERWGLSLRQQKNVFYDALLYRLHPRLYREQLRRRPPWHYHLIVLLSLAALPLAATGHGALAAACGAGALLLVGRFAAQRLKGAAHTPAHVVEMLATSALIPFLSVYWRLRGAWHFRVWFP